MKTFFIPIFISIFLIVSCKPSVEETPADNERQILADEVFVSKQQFANAQMQMVSPDSTVLHKEVFAKGMVDVPPENAAFVSPNVGGFVVETQLLIGDEVKKGQKVFTLTHPDYVELQQNYLEAQSQLQYLKSEYERQQNLLQEKITSEKNFLKAQSDYQQALAIHNGFSEKLRLLNLNPTTVKAENITDKIHFYAPISGTVTQVNLQQGQYISPAYQAMEIVSLDHLHLELNVYEKDVIFIKPGQSVSFKIPEISDLRFSAHVHLVGKSIDPQTRTVKVHAHLSDEEVQFIRGMFVDAVIAIKTFKALTLPRSALVNQENKWFVLKLVSEDEEGYLFRKETVEIGLEDEEAVELIKSELTVGDKILGSGAFELIQSDI